MITPPDAPEEEPLLARLHAERVDGARGVEVLTSQLARLQRVTSLLAETVSLADVRRLVLTEMPAAVGAQDAVLGLAVDDGARLALAGGPRSRDVIDRGAAHPLAAAFREGAPVSTRDWETLDPARRSATCAVTCLPLVAMGEPLGALGFAFGRTVQHTVSDRALLLDLARQTACALQRSRLYDAARAGRDRLALLAEATARIASAKLDLEGVLDALVREVTRSFADACGVSLVQRHDDPPVDACAGPPFVADHDVVERVLGSGKAELVAGRASTRSLLVVPLRASGDVLGVIRAARDRPEGRFSADDLVLLQDLADRAGLAVQNALLFREVERGRRTADEANRAKDDFLAVLGHELRNPLSPIATALHLMELRGGHVLARERQVIERQVRHMTALVDDLLDLARITRGKLELKRAQVDLADVVAKAVEMTSPLLEARAQHLKVDVSPGLLVDGDARRLAQVVANLLSNAAKYTPSHGHVRVAAGRAGAEVELIVQDDGIGIEPALLSRIFHSFVQAPRSNDRAEGGLGIGLTIVQRLVELHGGGVSAASQGPGTGSTLTVRLPALLAAEDEPPAFDPLEPVHASSRRRLLVVDDNRDAVEMLGTALRLLGHDVREAFDGPGALDVLTRFRPDLAFLDIGLPVMDGYELAGRIHALAGLERLPLVAVTGYGQDWDRARSLFAGFAEHLVKPVDLSALTTLIETLAVEAS
jgi:signal transduction histidine kinase/ActR/RegA family two-component response regulator